MLAMDEMVIVFTTLEAIVFIWMLLKIPIAHRSDSTPPTIPSPSKTNAVSGWSPAPMKRAV